MLRSTSTRDTFSSVALFSHILEILPFSEKEKKKRGFSSHTYTEQSGFVCCKSLHEAKEMYQQRESIEYGRV